MIVDKANQNIATLSVTGAIITDAGGGIGSVTPTTSSAGLVVTFTASNGNVNVVNNLLSCTTPGTYTIYGNQAGDGNYNAANQVSVSITVIPAAQDRLIKTWVYTNTGHNPPEYVSITFTTGNASGTMRTTSIQNGVVIYDYVSTYTYNSATGIVSVPQQVPVGGSGATLYAFTLTLNSAGTSLTSSWGQVYY